MEMEYNNASQCEIEITDPKILKAQKQIFAFGLSGILVPFSSWFGGCMRYLGIRMFIASLFEFQLTAFEFLMSFLFPWVIGMILDLVAMIKAKKLKKIGQLKGKSITGYVLANISFWWGVVVVIPCVVMVIMMFTSGQISTPIGTYGIM